MPLATSPADLLDMDELLSMSGLAFMTGMLEGTLPGPPIAQTMGYRLHAVEDGRVTFRGAPKFNVTNPMGTVHGGWYGTLLDSAMACAVMTRVPSGVRDRRRSARERLPARSSRTSRPSTSST